MRVIKDKKIIEDSWTVVDAGPVRGLDAIVSVQRWNAERDVLRSEAHSVGVILRSDEDPGTIEALDELQLVAIDFPKFSDGRGYSSARLLRERFGFNGELRAVGDVLRDQLQYMARCGITSFALKAGKDAPGAISAFDDFSVTYQPAVDEAQPLFRRVER